MRNVAVVGAGVIGINTLLRLIDERDLDTHITWIYDSTAPIFGIGESTTPDLPSQIAYTTNLVHSHLQKYFDGTTKYGMKFIGWGRKHNFIHWLSLHEVGMHFDTKKFSEFFLEYLPKTTYDFELLDEKITHVGFDNNGAYLNNKRYDFIMDCTGGTSLIDHDHYFDSPFESVNNLLACPIPEGRDWGVTINYAHKNGWMFGIPLKSRHTYGYCFDSNITSIDEATEDFKTIIPEANDIELRHFKWKPRLSTYLLHYTGRYARNGNAIGFIDPLEGLAGQYYDRISDRIVDYILDGEYDNPERIDHLNDHYYSHIIDEWLRNTTYCYHFGSKYDTPFWRNMVTNSRDYLNNKELNPCNILDGNHNFTEDLFNIIGDDPILLKQFRSHKLLFDPPPFCSNYRDFTEFAYGMGADYAKKYPLLVPIVEQPEPHGELSHNHC